MKNSFLAISIFMATILIASTGNAHSKEDCLKSATAVPTPTASPPPPAITPTAPAPPQQPQSPPPPSPPAAPPPSAPILPLLINEFLPDPEGSDNENEWIEIKNPTDQKAILDGWTLDDGENGSKPFALNGYVIEPESFLVLTTKETKIALNNDKDEVRLIAYDGKIIDQIGYEKTEVNKSYARTQSNTWEITDIMTPGKENIFPETISTENGTDETDDATVLSGQLSEDVEISEVMPNPSGPDKENEWIELFNSGEETVNLENWKIKTKTRTFHIPPGIAIGPNEYLILKFEDIKLTLKNSKNEIFLVDPEENEIDNMQYNEAPENVSFAKIKVKTAKKPKNFTTVAQASETEQMWIPTGDATPGGENPTHYIIEGKIETGPEANVFQMEANEEKIAVSFGEEKLDPNLAQLVLKPGNEIKLTATKKDNRYELQNFEIISQNPESAGREKKSIFLWMTVILLGTIGASIFGYKKLMG